MKPEDLLELKTYEQLRDDAIADLQSRNFRIKNFRAGRVFYTLLELAAKAVASLFLLLAKVLGQQYLDTAKGGWLDIVAADRAGVYRKQAQKAKWQLRAGRTDTTERITIPAGVIATTEEDSTGKVLRYLVTTRTVLEPGVAEITLEVEAELGGSEYNVGPGQISSLTTFQAGIDYVTNDAEGLILEGTDIETDEALRMRAQNKNVSISYGGNKAMYKSMAEDVVGVAWARVDTNQPRGEGTIDVVIIGTDGVPTQVVIDQVKIKYDDDASVLADIAVYPCEELTVPVELVLYKKAGVGDSVILKMDAENMVAKMFSVVPSDEEEPRFDIDYGIDRSLLMSLRQLLPDLRSVDVIGPSADVAVSLRQLAIMGTITITVQEV